MCGICGILEFSLPDVREDVIARMTHTLEHRGPDDQGTYVPDETLGLGQTRLSIIDLSDAGHQPMLSEDGACVLVYNGEIYNFPELREELRARGVAFRGRSDTEVVLQAFLQWGVEAFAKIEGMFALGLWDRRRGELHLARDRFGIKPLYYLPLESGIVFGSEIKAILASRRASPELNSGALHEYLYYGTTLGSHTLYQGIHKLLPGHRLTVDRRGHRLEAYASIYDVAEPPADPHLAVEETRRQLEQAVKRHLISDVPVAIFLSGGTDSSTITALASRHYDGRLQTFSVGYDFDRGINELPQARLVAERFGTDHHELHIAGKNMPQVIEHLVRCHDHPFADAANIPLYLMCEEIRGSVKVVLQGDGGDEIFGGYRRYNVLSYERLCRAVATAGLALGSLLPRTSGVYRGLRFLRALAHPDPAMRMALLLTEETLASSPLRVLSPEARRLAAGHDPFARYRYLQERFADLDPVQRMLYTDCSIILPDIFLEKVDRATMAHGVEVRVPMLDTQLARHVMGFPARLKVRSGQKKRLLRYAMRGIVPDQVLDGKKKGFGVPYAWWLRESLHEYLKSVLLDPSTLSWGLFDEQALIRCLAEHKAGKRDNGFLLYKLLNLALWRRFYLAEN